MLADNDTIPTQDFNMDIDSVFKPLFSPEAWQDISDAIAIQEQFSVPDIYLSVSTLVARLTNEETDSVKDDFYYTIKAQTDSILKAHGVHMQDYTPLRVIIDIAETFLTIQHLSDYDHLYSLFQGNLSDEDRLLAILCEHTIYDEAYLLSNIKSFDSVLLLMLKAYCERQIGHTDYETDQNIIELKAAAIKNMSVISNIAEHAIGVQLVLMNMLLAQPLITYINLAKENIDSNPDENDLAIDFISLCLISQEMKTNPHELWSQYSNMFEMSLNKAMSISNKINAQYNLFLHHMRVSNEKT